MRKRLLFFILSLPSLVAGAAVDNLSDVSEASVSERPEGTSRLWTKSSYGYKVYLEEYAIDLVSNGSVVETVENPDGTVWFNNPTIGLVTPNWYRGERSGNNVVIKCPQEIAVDPEFGRTLYLMPCEYYEDEWMSWYRPVKSMEFTYVMSDDSITSDDKEIVLGLCYMTDGGDYRWAGYGDYDISMTPHSAEPLKLPEGLNPETWILSDGEMGHEVSVAVDGDHMYVGGVLESLPDAYVKGSILGSEVIFDSNQYLGIDAKGLCDAYFIGAEDNSFVNEYGEYVVMFDMHDSITFSYDAELGEMTSTEEAILVNAGTVHTNKIYSANHPSIRKLQRVKGAAPATPEFTDVMWYELDFGFGVFAYKVPNIDVNGYPLPTERLYYKVYYNGDEVEFYPDECPGLEEPTIMIPYDFYDNVGIYGDDTGLRTIIYYSYGVDSISLMSVFIEEDGTEVCSEMVTISQDPVNVDSVKENIVQSVRYYDMGGREVSRNAKGILVEKIRFTDGTESVSKIIR